MDITIHHFFFKIQNEDIKWSNKYKQNNLLERCAIYASLLDAITAKEYLYRHRLYQPVSTNLTSPIGLHINGFGVKLKFL